MCIIAFEDGMITNNHPKLSWPINNKSKYIYKFFDMLDKGKIIFEESLEKGKSRKSTRRMRTKARAVIRELPRKMNDKLLKPHVDALLNSTSVLLHQKNDKGEI
jgi:hypothetical protein